MVSLPTVTPTPALLPRHPALLPRIPVIADRMCSGHSHPVLQVRHLIEGFWKDTHLQHGYQLLYTPHIAKVDLWKTSGHFDFYRESMFNQMDVDAEEYQA